MKEVRIETGQPYVVTVGEQLSAIGTGLRERHAPCAAMLVADDTVNALYGDAAAASLTEAGFSVSRFAFPHGEGSKNLSTLAALLDALAAARLTRTDVIVALGGGVTGDLAGFAAAVYLRGIPYVQVPTTLLAAVDSSVGGKTGVDLPAGKNLVGAFHQPLWVLCDLSLLHTLSDEAFAGGLAEMIKYGVIADEALFETLASGERTALEKSIARCVELKGALVAQDERDTGCRQLLNLGHTLGHAVEQRSGYSIAHGQAVAIGMAYIARAGERAGLCAPRTAERIGRALTANGLPVECPYPVAELVPYLLADKKRKGDAITLVLPERIGACVLHAMPVDALPAFLAQGEGR